MYYPKSQIIENQCANPGEFVKDSTGEPYSGPYYKTSDGSFFTGKNPQDTPNVPLKSLNQEDQIPLSEPLPESYYLIDDSYYIAKGLKVNRNAPRPPISSKPFPTESNYKLGEFERYFLKKRNDKFIIEVNKKEYDLFKSSNLSVQSDLYKALSFNWQISGIKEQVGKTNKNITTLMQKRFNFEGLLDYFKLNFTQYFKYIPAENLVTEGNEFKEKKTGKIYVGPYHIHPDKGPMVGATHVPYPHDFLIPISGSLERIVLNLEQETQPQTTYRRSGGSSGGY